MKKQKTHQFISFAFNVILSVSLVISLCINIYVFYDSYDLDIFYKTEYKKTESNVEKVNIIMNGSDEWRSKADLYYNKLVDYYILTNNDKMIEQIEKSQKNWDVYVSTQVDIYNEFLVSAYGSGTIVPIKQSCFIYNLNKERALYLYEQCLVLSLDVDHLG